MQNIYLTVHKEISVIFNDLLITLNLYIFPNYEEVRIEKGVYDTRLW